MMHIIWYNEICICFHCGDDVQMYFIMFLLYGHMGSYSCAILYLKLNGIPSQPVSRYLSNISKTYQKIEVGPELLTTRYCTIWQNYPPWSSIIYSSSGRIGQGTNALEIASGYNEGRSCGYQILSEREFLRKFPYRFMSPFERPIHGYFTWRMYHRKGHTSLCHRVI